jgi:tetratricopeptide (TPR) repeat protein
MLYLEPYSTRSSEAQFLLMRSRKMLPARRWFLQLFLGVPAEIRILLGDRVRANVPYVGVETDPLWMAEPFSRKAASVLRRRWRPREAAVQTRARELYSKLYFGGEEDCGHHLLLLNDWHLRRDWELDALTASDQIRAKALATFSVLTRLRFAESSKSPLNLQLGLRMPFVADLIYPLVAKMPIFSLRYFLDLHVHYAFNAIRRANLAHADDIISLLYDVLFLQQKTAISLLECVRLTAYADQHKGEALLLNAEVDAIIAADTLFAYLKASVEKTIALVGVTHGIANLDAKKDHKKRVAALRAGLPAGLESLPYTEFLFAMVGAENLEDLNNYRSGLLHKKGVADLQPHNYVGHPSAAAPFRKVLTILHEQHVRNTALLLVALALLTDKLVELDRPPFDLGALPNELRRVELPIRLAAEEALATKAIASAGAGGLDGASGDLFAARGRLRRGLSRDREALADFREALARGAEPRAEILYELGRACMDVGAEGMDAAAVDAFTEAIELAPDLHKAYFVRALAYENLGQLEAALADLDFVVPRASKPAPLLEKRGVCRLALGRYAEALADLDAAAALGHCTLDLLTGRGVALRALGDNAGSLASLTSAIERFPDAVVARMHRASGLMVAGDTAAAQADLDQIIGRHGSHPKVSSAFGVRAILRSDQGDQAGAEADMEQAIARYAGSPPHEWIALLATWRATRSDGVNADR